MGKIDIVTSTLGKALGGASGGFTCGKKEMIELLRQRSRPYLFSNTVAPVIVYATMRVLDLLTQTSDLRQKLNDNTKYFREKMTEAGFDIRPGIHPIVPIMLGEARLAKNIAADMFVEGIYVIGFSFPVVPRGEARIRVQLSAAHKQAHLDKAIKAFKRIGQKYGILGKTMSEILEMNKS
jgi:glycine C-acetyltransferase